MSSLERLLRLAWRTGDRLIVCDKEGERDLVIMRVGEYEALLDSQERQPFDFNHFDTAEDWDGRVGEAEKEMPESAFGWEDETNEEARNFSFSNREAGRGDWVSTAEVMEDWTQPAVLSVANKTKGEITVPDLSFEPGEPTLDSGAVIKDRSGFEGAVVAASGSERVIGVEGQNDLSLKIPKAEGAPALDPSSEGALEDEEPVFYEEQV